MKLFEAIFKQIQAKNKKKDDFSLIREKIDDSSIEDFEVVDAYHSFGNELFQEVLINYQAFLQADPLDNRFHFIKQNGISGFAIDCYKFDHHLSDWRLLQLHCLNVLKQEKYIVHLNQLETKNQGDNLKTSYKFYLKPSIKLMTSIPSQQLYGNVSIEILVQNDEVFRFLLHANYYSDRNYLKEKNFLSLLKSL